MRTLPIVAAWTLLNVAAMAQVPIGDEFRINETVGRLEQFSSVCVDGQGRFLVVWDEESSPVFVKAFDPNGESVSGPTRLTGPESASGRLPDCDVTASGTGAVVWAGGLPKSIAVRQVSSAGEVGLETIGLEENVFAANPKIRVRADGEVLALWGKLGSQVDIFDLWVQRVSADGVPVGPATRVAQDQEFPSQFPVAGDVAWLNDGRFVVVWSAEGLDADQAGVRARIYDANGEAEGESFRVNTYELERQVDARVDADALGRFVVVWDSVGQDGSGEGIYAQRFDPSGAKLGAEFQVSSTVNSGQYQPAISVDAAGNFAISFSSTRETNELFEDVFLRVYRSDGTPYGEQVLVSQQPPGSQDFSSVALSDNGTLIVTWHSEQTISPGQTDEDIMARRFFVPCLSGGPAVLELDGGRYSVCAQYVTTQGWAGNGQAISLTEEAGGFWFFDPEVLEVAVKIVDGCSANGHHWIYAAGLTNVGVDLQVRDRWTGETWSSTSPLGTAFEPVQNIEALHGCTAAPAAIGDRRVASTGIVPPPRSPADPGTGESGRFAACIPDATHLCLQGGRFRVSAEYSSQAGSSLAAQAAPLLDDSGAFWFFGAENLELFVKLLDGCALNGRYWVFAAGLTNLGVSWRVEDSLSGMVQPYESGLWTPFQTVLDISAFAVCP